MLQGLVRHVLSPPRRKKSMFLRCVKFGFHYSVGTPKRILSDNGGEFNKEDLREMGENLNTTITTTAAESP